jgi:DNA-binding transcriptional LysR family regulator
VRARIDIRFEIRCIDWIDTKMRLASFDMNSLVALDALLNEQSVSRAAERLRVGQPAMSATLGRLRAAFGDPLLVRSGRGLQRTGFADSLMEPLGQVLHDIEQLLDAGTAFNPGTARRTFTVITSDYVALVLLRPLIERLNSIAPTITMRVIPAGAELLEHLRRGVADLAIYPGELLPIDMPFESEHLFADDFVCATDIANSEVNDELSLEQLQTLPYLAVTQGSLTSLPDKGLDQAQIPRNTAMVAESFVTAPFLLPGTRMYTIIQRRLAHILLPDAHFKILKPPIPIAAIHQLMVWSPRRGADVGHSWLREQLHQTAQLID